MKNHRAFTIGLLLAALLGACGKDSGNTKPQEPLQGAEQANLEDTTQTYSDWRAVIQITDRALLREIQSFTHQCYYRARNSISSSSEDSRKLSAEQDTQWIGSKFFLETAGYYDSFTAVPLTSIPHDVWPNSKLNENGQIELTCKEWWQNEKYGLYPRLLNAVKNPELLTRIGYWIEPLPKLKTQSDYQQFFEQGSTCRNNWSEIMVTNHIIANPPDLFKIQLDSLKTLKETAQASGFFTTELIPSETYPGEQLELVLRPNNQKIIAFNTEIEEIRINQELGTFDVVLNANVALVRERIAPLALKELPPSEMVDGGGIAGPFLLPTERDNSSVTFIDVRKKCVPSKTNPQNKECQENKSVVSCFYPWFD
jgi:hypothetical protein